jgi:hypothetical protein
MKLTKITNHGKTRWRVNDATGLNGKRQRRFFESKEDAEIFVRQQKADQRAFGNHYLAIPPAERAVICYQLERLCVRIFHDIVQMRIEAAKPTTPYKNNREGQKPPNDPRFNLYKDETYQRHNEHYGDNNTGYDDLGVYAHRA